jgi:hypothetical protein
VTGASQSTDSRDWRRLNAPDARVTCVKEAKSLLVRALLAGILLIVAPPLAGTVLDLDWNAAHDPAAPLPRFITHHYIALADVESLSKFRSGYGHVFSDEYEAPDRSMKHYIVPLPAYRQGNATSLRVFAPVTGRVVTVRSDDASGIENFQIHIVPDGFPAFEVRLFHVNPAAGIAVGVHVVGGQPIGFADMRQAENNDIAVEGIVLGAPAYPSPMRTAGFFPDRGIRMFSQFDVMTDALFADYQARGIASRDAFIIPRAFRDANPATTFTYRADEFVVLGVASAPHVVEFYHAGFDHYFITASGAEIADLDGGAHAGWVRTGNALKSLVPGTNNASPVCRLYIPPAQGDSHFYSASPAECAETAARFPTFIVESADVFSIGLPDPMTGACPSTTVPVYRVWNQRADSNHRYVTSRALRDQMVPRGYVAEGYGPDAVIMCAGS